MDRNSAEKELHRMETHWINTLLTITPLGLNYITTNTTNSQITHKTTNPYTHKPPSTNQQKTKTTARMLPPSTISDPSRDHKTNQDTKGIFPTQKYLCSCASCDH